MDIKKFMAVNEVEIFTKFLRSEKVTALFDAKQDVFDCTVISNVSGRNFNVPYYKSTILRRKGNPIDPTPKEVFTMILRNDKSFRYDKSDFDTEHEDRRIRAELKQMFKNDIFEVYDEILYE